MTMIEKTRDDENDDDRNVLTDSVIDHCCTNILSLTGLNKFVSTGHDKISPSLHRMCVTGHDKSVSSQDVVTISPSLHSMCDNSIFLRAVCDWSR